ncbi:MAG TPA: GNAT family N-acetyltransferase [Clostridiaceae bacterium]
MIKVASINDIKLICEFKLRLFEESGHIKLLHEDVRNIVEKEYIKMYSEQKAIHFFEEVDGKIISCAGAFIKSDIPYCFFETPFYGFIGDVYTLPEYRKNGYATKLTNESITWLRNKGVKNISLLATEQARNIYSKIGFKSTDDMKLFFE